MHFATAITECPDVYDRDVYDDVRQQFRDMNPTLQHFLGAVASVSPFLADLLRKEDAWLRGRLDALEIDQSIEIENTDDIGAALRSAKRRVALWTALCDFSGIWQVEQVCATLTNFADRAVQCAFNHAISKQIARGKLPGLARDAHPHETGLFVLAMGKMGAGELNYSSDIDLICLFDEARFPVDDFFDARAALIKATRTATALLNDITRDGYVFRTDLRLRPDPAVTPVCMGVEAAERYYESLGRTWERAAYIKARVCAGDQAAGEAFLKSMRPFVWRKHLDFAAIQDAHAMRLGYREKIGQSRITSVSGHNVKLGLGGIREIEFVTQTQQLIAGGRDPDLRVQRTKDGLQQLAAKGWITADLADGLYHHYCDHRKLEHRLQMVNDEQTHDLPSTDAGFDRLAAMSNTVPSELKTALKDRFEAVHDLTEGFFAKAPVPEPEGAQETADEEKITQSWPSYPALRSERAYTLFQELRPELMARLRAASFPDQALVAFDRFLSKLPAGVQLFSLFRANPQMIDLLIDILGTAPSLSEYLSQNVQVLDAVIGGSFWDDWPGEAELRAQLIRRLAAETDYERQLDLSRRWSKEWHFRIGVHVLRGLIDAGQAGREYADLARATLGGIWPSVCAEFARKHGPMPGRGAVVLGMGSLGAGRLHAHSDLDVIVIYDADGVDTSDGRRPLPARTYYARLTQALITAMTAPMSEGRLYEMDMRLRPSGNKGPVATSWTSFQDYQINEAWVWEHLALTRAVAIVGPDDLIRDIDAFRVALADLRNFETVAPALSKMRARISSVKSDRSAWDFKIGSGRLQDIELFSQMGSLLAGQKEQSVAAGITGLVDLGIIDQAQGDTLQTAYEQFWTLQLGSKLLSDGAFDPEIVGDGGQSFILGISNSEQLDTLQNKTTFRETAARSIIETVLPEPQEDVDERG
jgi:glutamate-ammonia-ligase adenylyltransferase